MHGWVYAETAWEYNIMSWVVLRWLCRCVLIYASFLTIIPFISLFLRLHVYERLESRLLGLQYKCSMS
jgi:hypothetical protein